MRSDADGVRSGADDFESIWTCRHVAATTLLGLPGIVISAGLSGILVTIFFDTSVAVAIALAVTGIIVVLRLVGWTRVVARRSVAVSDTHLAVRRGDKILAQVLWRDMASVQLVRGDSLLRLMFDVSSGDASFPHIVAQPVDAWDVRASLPSLMAVLPDDATRLELALVDACAARGLPFTIDDGR